MSIWAEGLSAAAGDCLVSPCCRGRVVAGSDGVTCRICGRRWPWVVPGFLDLSDADPYWGELSRDRMGRLLERAQIVGLGAAWEEAAPTLGDPNLPRYALSPLRGAFLSQVLPQRPGVALDIGAGFGAISRELTRYFDVVIAMEPVRERVEHIALAGAPGPGLLLPVRGTWEELPVAAEAFDLVVAVGVLEWVGFSPDGRRAGTSPRQMQLEFLRHLRGILRPGGQLVVGIENRFGLDLLRGAPDHLGFRYTTLLPRWMADRVVRWRARADEIPFYGDAFQSSVRYRVWTYSASGYERLLAEAGFHGTETICTWGSYVFPKLLGSAAGVARILAARSRLRSSRTTRALWRRLGPAVVRAVSPSFFIVGRKEDPSDRTSHRKELVLLDTHLEGGTYTWALFENGSPVAVLQRPVEPERTGPWFHRGLERVRDLASRRETPEVLRRLLPEPVDPSEHFGHADRGLVRAWRWFEGRAEIPGTLRELDRLMDAAGCALDALDGAAAAFGTRELTEKEAWEWVADRTGDAPGDPGSRGLAETIPAAARRRLAFGPWGLMHGDFWWGNLLLDAAGRPRLCDWEDCEETGWRPLDPLLFALTLLLDLYPANPFAGPWSDRVLGWAAGRLGWSAEEVRAGLELTGRIKAWRERSRYGQRNTPVQSWLGRRPRSPRAA